MSEDMAPHQAADVLDDPTFSSWRGREKALDVLKAHARSTPPANSEYQRGFADGYRAGVNESGAADAIMFEIMDEEAANTLPDGSIVKPADRAILPWARIDGKWHRACTPNTPRELPGHGPWLVLYRAVAPDPPTPVRAGDVIPGERARALGEGAVVIEERGIARTNVGRRWEPSPLELAAEYTVLRPPFDQDGASS